MSDSKQIARLADPEERAAILERARTLKMARSAHAYVRGATANFYEWMSDSDLGKPARGAAGVDLRRLPRRQPRPAGRARTARSRIQIRDLDQTVVGNPAHDLIRLGLSLATAARGSDLPGVTTAHMLEEMVVGYQEALRGRRPSASMRRPCRQGGAPVLMQALRRRWEAPRAGADGGGAARHSPRQAVLAAVGGGARGASRGRSVAATSALSQAVTAATPSHAVDEVLDAAYWMKGCSSLGAPPLRCAARDRRRASRSAATACSTSRRPSRRWPRARRRRHAGRQRRSGRERRAGAVAVSWRADAAGPPARPDGRDPRIAAAGPEARDRPAFADRGGRRRPLSCGRRRSRPRAADAGAGPDGAGAPNWTGITPDRSTRPPGSGRRWST